MLLSKYMQTHELKNPGRKYKKRIGRGGKRGSYSGRGVKGQHAHAGGRLPRPLDEAVKVFPKLRGARAQMKLVPRAIVVRLASLERVFQNGASVTLETLRAAGLAKGKGKVKILSGGEVTKKLTVQGIAVSQSARESIEKAGGAVYSIPSI